MGRREWLKSGLSGKWGVSVTFKGEYKISETLYGRIAVAGLDVRRGERNGSGIHLEP
jgi:hypothetical protein